MSNTFNATLTTAQLLEEAVVPLQGIAAPLKAFSRIFSPDRYKPKATCQCKFVTVASSVQTNATNFESGDSTITNKAITVDQISISWQCSNVDLQSGLRLQDLVAIHARKFASTLMGLALAPVTEANFANYSGGSYIAAPATFGWGDMSQLWGALKKADVKHAILDGEYLSPLLNSPTFVQPGATSDPSQSAIRFGWAGLHLNTDWTGAGTGIRGFVCSPQAVGVVAGFPLSGALMGGRQTLDSAEMVLPGLDLPVQLNRWFSLAGRTEWMSLDTMFGAALLDNTAGICIKST